jgi:hypothetical protein
MVQLGQVRHRDGIFPCRLRPRPLTVNPTHSSSGRPAAFASSLLPKALVAGVALCASGAFAQSSDAWQFSGSLNLFLPSVSGSSSFPASGGGSVIDVNGGNVYDSLNAMFMGSLEARKGPWGMFTDVIYLDLSTNKAGSREFRIGRNDLPVGASANLELGLTGWAWTLGGSYRLAATPRYQVDVLAGARLLDIETQLDWTLGGNVGSVALADRTGSRTVTHKNWDFIVGAKGRLGLDGAGKWFVPYYMDIGAGDSQMTVQAMTGVGYAFSWGDVIGSWRYLGYEMKSGSSLQDLSLNGPMVSAVFRW